MKGSLFSHFPEMNLKTFQIKLKETWEIPPTVPLTDHSVKLKYNKTEYYSFYFKSRKTKTHNARR